MQESCKNIFFFPSPCWSYCPSCTRERNSHLLKYQEHTGTTTVKTLCRDAWQKLHSEEYFSSSSQRIQVYKRRAFFFFFWKNALGCRSEADWAASSSSQATASQSAMGSVKNWSGAGGGDLCTATAKHSQQVISPLHVSPTSAAPQRRPSGSHVISRKLSQRANNGGVHSDPTPVFPKVKKIWIRNPIIVAQNKYAIESLIKSPVCFFFSLCTVPE